jgi:hypothetical protein
VTDHRIRDRLVAELGPVENAHAMLEALTPSFARAARIRRAQGFLAGAALLLAFAGGAGYAASLTSDGDRRLTVADDGREAATSAASVAAREGHPTTLQVELGGSETTLTGSTGAASSSANEADGANDGDGEGAGLAPVEDVGPTTSPGPPSTAPTTPPSTTPTTEPRTTSPDDAPLGPGETRVSSECGSIVVRVQGSSVSLVTVEPDPGYQSDVKSAGPEVVEVGLEGRREHCELRAEMVDGRLVASGHDDD